VEDDVLHPDKMLACRDFAYGKLLEGPKTWTGLVESYLGETSDAAEYAPLETISACFNLGFGLKMLVDAKKVFEKDGVFYAIS